MPRYIDYTGVENCGVTEADANRSYLDVPDLWKPEQDPSNYKPWLTQNKNDDYGLGPSDGNQAPSRTQQEWDFQNKNRTTTGLLRRPTLPIER